jgi:predicted nucleic acid-binding protein
MRFLLDTCILVDHLRGHAAATRLLAKERRAAISTITWMEVMAGAIDEEEGLTLRAFLDGFELLAIDAAVAEEAVLVRRARRLKLPNAVILATARVHRLDLVTRNTKDFRKRDPGIVVPYELR